MAKSSKTLGDAVASVLQKHQLRPQDAVITVSGSKEPLNLDTTVLRLANKTLCLDQVKSGVGNPALDRGRLGAKPKNEMDGLVEMLTRAQCSRADDQRGLLTKEQLELPSFLQIPDGEEENGERQNSAESCCSKRATPSQGAAAETRLCVNGNPKDCNKEKKTGPSECAGSVKGATL